MLGLKLPVKQLHDAMMQFAAQWLEYRSPLSDIDDVVCKFSDEYFTDFQLCLNSYSI